MLDLTKKYGVPWEDEPHAPTPWSEFAESGDWWIQGCDAEGNPSEAAIVCDANDMSAADMLFIVQACNAHDALVAACEAWDKGFVDGEDFDADQFLAWVNANRRLARAALAKARGK